MKKILSLIICATMVLSVFATFAPATFAAPAAFEGNYLLYEAASGNGMSKGTADGLKGITEYEYTESLNVIGYKEGAYIGIWIGKTGNFMVGYDFDTQQFIASKRKLTSAGGFNTADVIGKKSYKLEANTDYQMTIKVSNGKASVLVNGQSVLEASGSNVTVSPTFVTYHSGLDCKIDNVIVKSGEKNIVNLDFEEAEDFDKNGWGFTLNAGFTIPGVVDKPKAIEGEYMMYLDSGYAYMQTAACPYDAAGFSLDVDVCPIDTTSIYGSEEGEDQAYFGILFAAYESAYCRFIRYNWSLQRFEFLDGWIPQGRGDVHAYVDYKWEDLETSNTYNWHKLSFRMFMNTISIYVDGEKILSFEQDEKEPLFEVTQAVIIPYSFGGFYVDNFKVGRSFSYDPVSGKGEAMFVEDFNSGKLDSFNGGTKCICSFGSNATVIQATTETVASSANAYNPNGADDPEVVIDRKVIYAPTKAKFLGSQNFKINDGEYVTSLDVAPIAPYDDSLGIFGFKFGAGNKMYVGYDMKKQQFVLGEWGGDKVGVANPIQTYDYTWETGEWGTIAIRHVSHTIQFFFDGEQIFSATDSAYIPDIGASVVFYNLAELYFDNWLLASASYDLVHCVGAKTYLVTFDSDNYDGVLSGIEESLTGYQRKEAACKEANAESPYGCNVKLQAAKGTWVRYGCQYCGNSVVYDIATGLEVPAVVEYDGLMGDSNGDGNANAKDVAAMLKMLAGQDVKVNETNSDVNGDGKVNAKDVAAMVKKLAGQDVTYVIPKVENDITFEGFDWGDGYDVVKSVVVERVDKGNQGNPLSIIGAGKSFGLKFDIAEDEYLQYVQLINAPSWSDNYGGLRASVYKWDTDYATTIANGPVMYDENVDYKDNSPLVSFHVNFESSTDERVTNGTYYVEFTAVKSKVDGAVDNGIGTWQASPVKDSRYTYFVDGADATETKLICMASVAFAYTK